MNISEAAERSGVSAKMIRYYESIDLLPPAARRVCGSPDYGAPDGRVVLFFRRRRDHGL